MQKDILQVPHKTLRAKSEPINDLTRDMQELLADLADTLKYASDPEGVGLSLPQIGHNLRGFATYLEKKIRIYVNPEILDQSEDLILGGTQERPVLEGCLSIPHLYGPVPRPKNIKIKALNEKGEEITKTLSSFPARVFMHEYDHLEGILFTDYTKKHNLPIYLLQGDEFIEIKEPLEVINW